MNFPNRGAICRQARLILVSSLAFLVTACSSTQVMQKVVPPGDGQALVYFLRDHYPPTLREVRIVVDGVTLATVAEKDFVAVNLPVGSTRVNVEASDGKPLSFQLPVPNAERMYLVLTGDVKRTGLEMTAYNELTVHMNWHLRAYRLDQARAESLAAQWGKRLK